MPPAHQLRARVAEHLALGVGLGVIVGVGDVALVLDQVFFDLLDKLVSHLLHLTVIIKGRVHSIHGTEGSHSQKNFVHYIYKILLTTFILIQSEMPSLRIITGLIVVASTREYIKEDENRVEKLYEELHELE